MLATKNPPGDLRSAASFLSAIFVNDSTVSAYMTPPVGANRFGSMLAALLVIAAMYWGLIFSLAEMSPALPHTGAAYSFARSAMGPWGGMVTGLAESIEYILTPAVIVYFIGTYMTAIFES